MDVIITISLLAILVLYLGLFKASKALLPVSIIGLIIALGLTLNHWGWANNARTIFSGMLLFNNFAVAFSALAILSMAGMVTGRPGHHNLNACKPPLTRRQAPVFQCCVMSPPWSRSSGDTFSAGTRYSSLAQAPRSISLQRSEQKGRQGLASVHCTDFWQVGHSTFMGTFHSGNRVLENR